MSGISIFIGRRNLAFLTYVPFLSVIKLTLKKVVQCAAEINSGFQTEGAF